MKANENGGLTVFMAVVAVGLMSLLGLVVDGGRAISEQQTLSMEAEQAARAGAGQLSEKGLRDSTLNIDPPSAMRSAQEYLARVGVSGTVGIVGQSVTVKISSKCPSDILGLVGVAGIEVRATSTVTNVHGVAEEDP